MAKYRSIVCPIRIAITLKKIYTNNRCLDNYLNMQMIAFTFMEVVLMSLLNTPFKALSDPTRRKIIQMLKDKDMTAGEIAEHFDISKPSISHHLSILKNAQLVMDERDGQNIIYSLNTTVFQEVLNWFFNIADIKGGTLDEKD